ncbi:phosphatidylinositol phosphate synthase [uncultured Actinomyces sp.]|uniref:phosphatidylinositol phosphate synthase n=1 Tax=uncultured Actinomyces sp. TaxID=249061 RepID=UPI002602C571|nr:CDP-alcohol phosphatidyltransferase family protein [uncultured Actinomyces sp.]
MLGNHGRGLEKQVFNAPAKALARLGVTPNQVTVVGTVLSIVAAVGLLGTGKWVIGPIVLAFILFADSLDGTLARLTDSSSTFGAFLDSTLDRLSDGAVFGSLTFAIAAQYAPSAVRTWAFIAGLISMIAALTVSYARARAEAVGAQAKGGIAERTDRLIIGLVGAFLVGLGLPLWVMALALTWVAFASLFTVGQRIFAAKRELSGK